MSIQMSHFAKRQYDKSFPGVRLSPTIVEELIEMAESPEIVFPGYASFCEIRTLKNSDIKGRVIFESFKAMTVEKQRALEQGAILHTAYEARSEQELPVLVEWITGIKAQAASYIHLILYSREQMAKEKDPIEADWGIVSVSASMTAMVEPMRPITALRNALGVSEGGSDSPINRKAYQDSVRYWSKYIMLRE